MSARDAAARMAWIESQGSGHGWNIAPRSDNGPIEIVARGPFKTLSEAIDRAMDIEADQKREDSAQ